VADGKAGEILVLGVGNPDRGDDGAGRVVARALLGALPAHIEVAEAGGEATDLLGKLEDAATAFIIDACASGAVAGTIHRFDVSLAPLPQGAFGVSTHGFGLHEAIELARVLGQLPPRCVVYAIEAASFATGAPLSSPVAAAVVEVASRLRTELIGDEDHKEPAHA
jgi:hydrogenase maturation protease